MSSLQHSVGPQAPARHHSTEVWFKLESLERRQLLSHAPPWAHHGDDLTVMSQNLYLGCDIAKLASAQSGMEVPGLVNDAWKTVQQTDFNARAKVIAKEIAQARPELIGLQEAALWRVQSQGDYFQGNPAAATEVKYDFVKILTDELAKRGLKYEAVATVELMDIELPNALPIPGTTYSDIRLTDRDVILARTDLPKSQLTIANARSGQYATTLPFAVGGTVLNVPRGWTSIDATIGCKTVHVVESHTETFYEPVQLAQINELLTGPANSPLPTILLGDYNSDANVPQTGYSMIAGAGFEDAWTETHKSAGLTWGHDETLRDAGGGFTQRLDLIMYKGEHVDARSMKIADRAVRATPTGPLWASDHAGVFSTINIDAHAPRHCFHSHGSLFDSKKDAANSAKDVLALV